jgi:hypothetical protein
VAEIRAITACIYKWRVTLTTWHVVVPSFIILAYPRPPTSDLNLIMHECMYEGESKIIRNVATYCAVGYTAGWA